MSARWYSNSPNTRILKESAKDGGAVLGTIEKRHFFQWEWSLPSGRYGAESTYYAACRAVQKAVKGEQS